MKKVFILLFLSLFFLPNTVFATVQVYDRHILFSYGLSNINISKERVGEGISDAIVLSGVDISQIKIISRTAKSETENRLFLLPGAPETNNYDFWKVKGIYNDKNFFLIGYTIENGGDTWIEKNSLCIDIIKWGVILSILGILLFVLKRKKKTKNIS